MQYPCLRCAHMSLGGGIARSGRSVVLSRNLSASAVVRADNENHSKGVDDAGRPISDATRRPAAPRRTAPPRLVIRREPTDMPQPSAIQVRPVPLRRTPTAGNTSGEGENRRPAGQFLRRSPSAQPGTGGSFLRRTGPSSPGQGQGQAQSRTGGSFLRRPGQGQQGTQRTGQRGQSRPDQPDRRRRTKRREEVGDVDAAEVESAMNEYIAKNIDPPQNITQSVNYDPTPLSLDELKSDWPNTPLTSVGITESVIQRIESLARRLPHGYMIPEDIAERYLRGELVRFESEEEKQKVLKIAAEQSQNTKIQVEDGTAHKHETPRFAVVEDPSFVSIEGRDADKAHLNNVFAKGIYPSGQQQRFAFMNEAARTLTNNNTYGQASMDRFLSRVNALIPQGGKAQQQAAKAQR